MKTQHRQNKYVKFLKRNRYFFKNFKSATAGIRQMVTGVGLFWLSARDRLSEMKNATKECGGEECWVHSVIHVESESDLLCLAL